MTAHAQHVIPHLFREHQNIFTSRFNLCMFLRQMDVCRVFVGVLVVVTLVAPLCCQNVTLDETRNNWNSSADEFDAFRAQFHRMDEVNSEGFKRRQLYFQVIKG